MWIFSSRLNEKKQNIKRADIRYAVLLACLSALLLCACSGNPAHGTHIQVSLVETAGMMVEENGLWIAPGENAVFYVRLDKNVRLIGLDYAGEYDIRREDGRMKIELFDVRYPARVALNLTSSYRTVHYVSEEGSFSVSYDISKRRRPNTATAVKGPERDGYTLIGWKTKNGERIGLGSRVDAEDLELTLYADWVPWTDESHFAIEDGTLVSYSGMDERIVIPETVTAIAAGAFVKAQAKELVLPKNLKTVEDGAFQNCAFEHIILFDSIGSISDASFVDCPKLQTLSINAVERPWGAQFRRESVYADKVDLLIQARGQQKLVFYGGCAMWYNLDGPMAVKALGDEYTVINMGLNGTVSGLVQMEIMEHFLEEGDVLFHTPELSSYRQLLTKPDMSAFDVHLWCGLEYNYDLFRLVDLRGIDGVFDSLCEYLNMKKGGGSYQDVYQDAEKREYMDTIGCLPIYRGKQEPVMRYPEQQERVELDAEYLGDGALLRKMYGRCTEKGITVLVGYACVNMDAVPEEQKDRVEQMDALFKQTVAPFPVISSLADYLYKNEDFYDTNYHLLSVPAQENTEKWLRDISAWLNR